MRATATQLTCFAPERAVVNYVEKQFSKRDYFTVRNEYMDDMRGQRTGFKDEIRRAPDRLGTLDRNHCSLSS